MVMALAIILMVFMKNIHTMLKLIGQMLDSMITATIHIQDMVKDGLMKDTVKDGLMRDTVKDGPMVDTA